ncbi:zinc metalloprotease, partial [Spiromyces aspiralis]
MGYNLRNRATKAGEGEDRDPRTLGPEETGDAATNSEAQARAVEALEKVVSSQGLLDDIIDGVRLGLFTIIFLLLVLLALLGGSTPQLFPVVRPMWDFVGNLPRFVLVFPYRVLDFASALPRTWPEAQLFVQDLVAERDNLIKTLPYKQMAIWFITAKYLWTTYLCVRQRDRLHEINRPHAIRQIVSRQKFLEANAYSLDKSSVGMVKDFYSTAVAIAKIVYGYYPLIWSVSGLVSTHYLYFSPDNEIAQTCVMLALSSVEETVLDLPFSLYTTFVIEEKHGFNNQTLSLFFSDLVKGLLISVTLGSLVTAGFVWVVHNTSDMLYLYTWLFLVTVGLLYTFVYPTLIQPLFNKVEPLPEGELRASIEALASRVNFPLKKLYQIDGSKRSSHSNAYMYGFFKNKHIVIYDTLIESTSIEETCAVLAHEIGHWKRGHVLRLILLGFAESFVMLYTFSLLVYERSLYESFGLGSMPVMIGYYLFADVYSPVSTVLYFIKNIVSRKYEFEADAFAKKLGYGDHLKSGLIKCEVNNKGNMNPDPLYSAYHYNHPPL